MIDKTFLNFLLLLLTKKNTELVGLTCLEYQLSDCPHQNDGESKRRGGGGYKLINLNENKQNKNTMI